MADNVAITAGAGTSVAADDIGSVFYQRVKPVWGADGVANEPAAATPLPVTLYPVTSGGASKYYLTSAATTNGNNVKASAGQVYGFAATNSNTSNRYLRFYNSASAPTVGTTATFMGFMLPGSGGIAISFPLAIDMTTGIGISLTTGAADTDTGAVAADEIKLTVLYK